MKFTPLIIGLSCCILASCQSLSQSDIHDITEAEGLTFLQTENEKVEVIFLRLSKHHPSNKRVRQLGESLTKIRNGEELGESTRAIYRDSALQLASGEGVWSIDDRKD